MSFTALYSIPDCAEGGQLDETLYILLGVCRRHADG